MMKKGTKLLLVIIGVIAINAVTYAQKLLIPMDLSQTDHLKAYGITYWLLEKGVEVDWLLNYRGGSFFAPYSEVAAAECRIRGVSFDVVDGATAAAIYSEVQSDKVNEDVVRLEKAPRIAVYAPPGTLPWDDAVLLALDYAEVKHDIIWDEEVIRGKLVDYDWLHLHHEDFTGQYGKFWANFHNEPWYIEQVTLKENMARKLGFAKECELQKAVALKIREYVASGGFLFAMCSATDSYDIALASLNVDICGPMFDGDPADPDANNKLDFTQTFAFENFKLIMDPYIYEYANIDIQPNATHNPESDYFTLFDFSAKFDPVPTMLTQSHANVIHGFMGQTTAFHKDLIKKSVTILAQREGTDEVKYICGNVGKGSFAWYGGHDPEDYRHMVGDKPTDLRLHKNSPGYRLILNNVLFPAARKKKLKT
jgi:hypothetical protein